MLGICAIFCWIINSPGAGTIRARKFQTPCHLDGASRVLWAMRACRITRGAIMKRTFMFAAVSAAPIFGTRAAVHIRRLFFLAAAVSACLDAAGAELDWGGGPVVSNAQVVMINWSADVTPEQAAMPAFYADIVQSDYWTILSGRTRTAFF
jgi:hypothetical protein